MSDARTLRLAHPALTPELVSAFIKHRRSHLERGLGDPGPTGSGIETNTFHQLLVASLDFCGRRATALRLKERRPTATVAQQEAIDKSLTQLLDDREFTEEWGEENLSVLKSCEQDLVSLHVMAAGLISPPARAIRPGA